MNTTFIMKLTLKDKDMTPFVEEALIDKGYGLAEENPSDADLVLTAFMHEDSDDAFIDRMIHTEVELKEVHTDFTVEVIKVEGGNVDEWKDFFSLEEYDEDIVKAVVENESSFLVEPERIAKYIDENYIGEFDDESDMARHLADEDPDIQALDDRIVNCMDLTEYYSDEMRFDMWHDGPYWFWNN